MSAVKKKVLIVEDDAMIRALLMEAFHLENCEPICAGSGYEAMRMLASEAVDVVLSDIRMANGSGIELLDYIQTSSIRKIPVYLMTAYADTTTPEAKDKGAEQLIYKPFNIFHIVNQVLGRNPI